MSASLVGSEMCIRDRNAFPYRLAVPLSLVGSVSLHAWWLQGGFGFVLHRPAQRARGFLIRFCVGSLSRSLWWGPFRSMLGGSKAASDSFCTGLHNMASDSLLRWIACWCFASASALGCSLVFSDVASAQWSAVTSDSFCTGLCGGGLYSLSVLGYSGGRFCSLWSCPARFGGGLPRDGSSGRSLLCMVVGVRWLTVSFARRWLYWKRQAVNSVPQTPEKPGIPLRIARNSFISAQ